jgi:hypothetical protein
VDLRKGKENVAKCKEDIGPLRHTCGGTVIKGLKVPMMSLDVFW